MSVNAKALLTLYQTNNISKNGLKQAVQDGVINAQDYFLIVGDVI